MNKKTENILKIVGAVVIGFGIGSLINKYSKKTQKPLSEEEKSGAGGRNFIRQKPKAEGHYCLKNGGNSGYFDTNPCIEGYTEVFAE